MSEKVTYIDSKNFESEVIKSSKVVVDLVV
jgi:hypothetical protein